jgi:nicotinate-nucleotide adenylyltransferase
MDTKRIGILGGTFNPVHNAHLVLASTVLEKYGLEKIIFIPTALPPHKSSRGLITAADRIAMLKLATQKYPVFAVSDLELKRGGKSYTVDTLRELREEFGPEVEFVLIIGSDNLLEIAEWREIETLTELCRFIVVTRPGYPLERLEDENARWAGKILKPDRSNIIELSVDISSSEIREKVRRKEDIRKLVPGEVADYIRRKRLYRSQPNQFKF